MKFLSLFSGIGGFDLGLERSGWQCVGQVEIDPFCQKVLAKHWPDVPRFDDVRTITGELVRERCGDIDAIVGGFPCQDISAANAAGKGIDGERSGLWREFYRLICEVRPPVALIENVPNLVRRGLDRVLIDLADARYDAEWGVISACMLGATHTRERLFVLAYANSIGRKRRRLSFAGDWPIYDWSASKAPGYVQVSDDWENASGKASRLNDGLS